MWKLSFCVYQGVWTVQLRVPHMFYRMVAVFMYLAALYVFIMVAISLSLLWFASFLLDFIITMISPNLTGPGLKIVVAGTRNSSFPFGFIMVSNEP